MIGRATSLICLAAWAATASGQAEGPKRIVTLAPHLTELVYAAGAGGRLVGTVEFSDFPPAALKLPRVGDSGRIDRERLLSLKPDLVLGWADGTSAQELALLKGLGVPFQALEAVTLDDVAALLETLGRRFGTEATAKAAAQRYREAIGRIHAAHRGLPKLRVFYQIWDAPLYTLGRRHVVSELLDLCAAENVFGDEPRGSFVVDLESVYAKDPDVIVLAGTAAEATAWRSAWRERPRLRAVTNQALISVPDPDLVDRMGPRLPEGAQELCRGLDALRGHLLGHATASNFRDNDRVP